jgi:2-iminobutanoate/2-iminopropanoate deaminase
MRDHRAIVPCVELVSPPLPPADEPSRADPTKAGAPERVPPRERLVTSRCPSVDIHDDRRLPVSATLRTHAEVTMRRREINPSTVFDSRQYGFSQAVAVEGGHHLFISGQVGVDTDERVVGHDLATQTEAALDNLAHVLEAAGGTLADVVSLRIYVVASAAGDLTPVGSALGSRFGRDRPPASTWLAISALAEPELLIEIEAQAVLP